MGGPNTHGDGAAYLTEQAARLDAVEKRAARAGLERPESRRLRQWAGKSAPASYLRTGVNGWVRGTQSAGSTMDALGDAAGILITEAGDYDIVAMQRGNGTDGSVAFINLSVNGDRDALRLAAGGVWTFDHSAGDRSFSTARYMGPVAAGSLITAGPVNTAGRDALAYTSSDYDGSIFIRRIS